MADELRVSTPAKFSAMVPVPALDCAVEPDLELVHVFPGEMTLRYHFHLDRRRFRVSVSFPVPCRDRLFPPDLIIR